MDVAAGGFEPFDGHLVKWHSGVMQGSEEFDIEGEAMDAQGRGDALVGAAGDELETALAVVDTDAQQRGDERAEDVADHTTFPLATDPAAKLSHAGGEEGGGWNRLFAGEADQPRHLGGGAGAVGIDEAQPIGVLFDVPARIDGSAFAQIGREKKWIEQMGMLSAEGGEDFAHAGDFGGVRAVLDDADGHAAEFMRYLAQFSEEGGDSSTLLVARNDEVDGGEHVEG